VPHHARVFEGVAKSQFPRKAVVFNSDALLKNCPARTLCVAGLELARENRRNGKGLDTLRRLVEAQGGYLLPKLFVFNPFFFNRQTVGV